jgi:hypothetical protein
MPPIPVEEKSMVPTILVGIGGTGAEILSRVRRLAEETYGGLKNFPIISFLWIDTDKGYKISNPEAAGSPFKDREQHWARVSGRDVQEIITHMDNYPWINRWFPSELERNITSLEAGAGQIRACGRFAFFCNYQEIRQKFQEARNRTKGHEDSLLKRYGVKVSANSVNVFVTGSMSGGTGSGMLIDLGYCIQHWLQGEGSATVTAIVPMPNAFAGIKVGDRVLANGYAALMELSYFSDPKTEYVEQYSPSLTDEVRSTKIPFDFTYLVGTKNGDSEFKLSQIREAIAQNIFLDLTSDFAPHKRSIRDNIKGAWATNDPEGRGYPKNFMSFGLSTIEIPITQIRSSLANRLATDLVSWWLNESVQLPAKMLEEVRDSILKPMRLTEMELLTDLSMANDRPIAALIGEWLNGIRNEISSQDRLQCTQQGVNVMGAERGKILQFIPYLQEKVTTFRAENLQDNSPDERVHGQYLQNMYRSREEIIKRGRKALLTELYGILSDRNRGVQFAESFLLNAGQIFANAADKFRQEQEKQSKVETSRDRQYEEAKNDINEFKDKFGLTKQAKMEQFCEAALAGIDGSVNAFIRRKSRALGLEVIARLQEHIAILERRLNRFKQRLSQMRDYFNTKAQAETDSADALEINGIKLYDRYEMNGVYQDLIEQLAGVSEGSKTRYQQGMDSICSTLSEDVFKQSSPLWKETRGVDEVMQLFDLTEIPEVQEEDLREIVYNKTKVVIEKAPQDSRLKRELAACDRIFKVFNDDSEIINNVRLAYHKSQPLILMQKAILASAGFNPTTNINVALLGGINTSDPAAQKMLPKIKEFVQSDDSIKPLGETERHRIVFVQETGGFSLRCIEGMKELRQNYQQWLGETIIAKRAKLKGEAKDPPIPVHLTKEPPFWDIFPEDPNIYKLVVQARALQVLFKEENRATQEQSIRYLQQTSIDSEKVDLASNWEEVSKVLEVRACRPDKEEIDRQVNAKLDSLKTEAQKQQIYQQLTDYLKQRVVELEKLGGNDSPVYKREKAIILDVINAYKLTQVTQTVPTAAQPVAVNLHPSSNGQQIPPATSQSNNNGSSFDRLKELMDMYREGLLSKEEFEAAKAKLLGI